jgi:hypothetical protein
MTQVPITYYPPGPQAQLEINRSRVWDKPYAHYFDERLWLDAEVLPALQKPLPLEQVLDRSAINRLLEPGYLDGETGYHAFEDGSGYVASFVKFPGVPIEALRWWWWWHSVETERYLLWFPQQHVSVARYDRDVLENDSLSDEERYVGSSHHISEFIGPDLHQIQIDFGNPSEFGLDARKIEAMGIVHGCGFVSVNGGRVRVATMIHLARPAGDGFEMRSRYWMGGEIKLRLFGKELGIDPLAEALGAKKRLVGASLAYNQLVHDQSEFTHLASFLGRIYSEFGPKKSG